MTIPRDAASRPDAFLSYSHVDDGDSFITTLRSLLETEMQIRLGRRFDIFQDIDNIQAGEDFGDVINEALDDTALFIPILTPSYFNSDYCRKELRRFLEREASSGRRDLIVPVYLVNSLLLSDDDHLRQAGNEDLVALKRHNWVDWRELRRKGVTSPDFRTKGMALADSLLNAYERAGREKSSQTLPDEDNYVPDIKAVLDEIRVRIQSVRFRRRYKAGVTLRVLTAARDEIQRLTGGAESYTQDLSLEENFIVRAGPIFSEASEVYAVSIDELSQFWVSETQRARAEEYTRHQPANTVRLFVFSSVENAHLYRYVLAAHYACYGKTGGAVLMCSRKQYQTFWAGIHVERVPELLRKDFAVLIFREGNRYGAQARDVEYYEATLSNTKLVCRQLAQLEGYHQVLVEKFGQMRDLADGDSLDGVTKWRENFKFDDEAWTSALARLFNADAAGVPPRDVIHVVFFSSQAPSDVIQFIEKNVRPKLETIQRNGTRLVEDFWFGSRRELELSVSDGIYNGKLRTSNFFTNSFPFALVLKFRCAADLTDYYADRVHAEVRKDLLSFCDPSIRNLYELVNRSELDGNERQSIFEAIEATASKYMLRSDFMLDSPLAEALKREPVPFELPKRSSQQSRAAANR